ncbi:tRNA pseudouridine(13) synthase TruD [Candidatus Woesearchaeota archaeon]|nr:tRNA pseudouridine(13) synthase TruD [Candidatus Woesearchaeota archaeon]
MKLRQIPDDFIVEEVPLHEWKKTGEHAVYKVSKVGMTTFAAEKALAKHCNVTFNKIGFAGMKDTHARTTQYFSVETNKPECGNFAEQHVTSQLIGYLDEPLKTGELKGNAFVITVRELKQKDVETAQKNLSTVQKGVPNYFDSQRFGSLKGTTGFIAKDILQGRYEEAVKKMITATTRHQKGKRKAVKKFIKENWQNWNACMQEVKKAEMEKTAEGTIVRHLAERPTDYQGAFRKSYSSIRQLFFSAYQSYLWNESIKRLVRQTSNSVFSVEYEAGKLVFPRQWNCETNTFPMVAPDMKLEEGRRKKGEEQKKIITEVLKQEGMQLTDFFTTEHVYVAREREVKLVPENLTLEITDDELNKYKKKAILKFTLQKGSYATIITKALFGQ